MRYNDGRQMLVSIVVNGQTTTSAFHKVV